MGALADLSLYLFLTILTFYVLARFLKRSRKLPPGPSGIPILGNLIPIVKDPPATLSKWAEIYGKLYTVKLGPSSAVVITDPKYAKDIFGTFAATGKFKNDTFLLFSRGSHGVMNTEGKQWVEQRKFCVRSLLELGFAGKSLEPLVLSEAQCLVDWIKKKTAENSGEVLLKGVLNLAMNNALWSIVSGERLPLEDTTFSKLIDRFMIAFQYTMKSGLGYFPWLKYLGREWTGYAGLDRASKEVHDFIRNSFEEHKKTRKPGSPRDLIDMYIEQMEKTEDLSSTFHGEEGMKNSVSSVVELFIAGSESLANTINFLIFYMGVFPEAQRKLHQEIDEVLGDRDPSLQDKANMKYVEATILETFRYSSFLHIGVIHQLLEEIQYEGYIFPKGTLILANLYGIHHSKSIWGDPENFRPERFLEGSREHLEKLRGSVLPFQMGKRICLAEHLSKDILFLFGTKLFRNFTVEMHPDVTKEQYLKPDRGHVQQAERHRVIIKNRLK